MTTENTTAPAVINAPAKAAIRDAIRHALSTSNQTLEQASEAATAAVVDLVGPLFEIKLSDAADETKSALNTLDKTIDKKLDGDDVIAGVKSWWVAQYDGGDRSPALIQLGELLAEHRTYNEADLILDESGRAQERTDVEDYISSVIDND